MQLCKLLEKIECEIFLSGAQIEKKMCNAEISSLEFDSRKVDAGSLFFALPGVHTDGKNFISQAILRGALAVIFEGTFDFGKKNSQKFSSVFFVKVSSARFSMAPISAEFFENPSEKLVTIGITGTEGKSSTVSFVWQLLRLLGKKAGFISTVEFSLGGDALSNPEHQTTPESPIVQQKLFEMQKNGCEFAVIESSSHGLSEKLNRLGNIFFDGAIFMNVTHEHLEFHKTYDCYKNDKANLFRKLDFHNHEKIVNKKMQKIPAFAIVNLDDKAASFFCDATKQQKVGFSLDEKNAHQILKSGNFPIGFVFAIVKNLLEDQNGISFNLEIQKKSSAENFLCKKSFRVDAPLFGEFNAANLTAAILMVSHFTKTPAENVASFAKNLVSVKGRMTKIDSGQNFEVIVDYAHTPSSFLTILPKVKNRAKNLIVVFGSAGERDTEKREMQGQIAAQFCDAIFLTDEDPRGEDPEKILLEIAEGAKKCGKILGKDLFLICDRKNAIRKAFQFAKKNDIVLLLGKSHEKNIIYKNFAIPYDEISEAKIALNEITKNKKNRV